MRLDAKLNDLEDTFISHFRLIVTVWRCRL